MTKSRNTRLRRQKNQRVQARKALFCMALRRHRGAADVALRLSSFVVSAGLCARQVDDDARYAVDVGRGEIERRGAL